jgi:hypothetical protein
MTAHSLGEVTLRDLRSIAVTKGFTHWRTAQRQSRRDLTKVDAQYPAAAGLGLAFLKEVSVPDGTIDQCWQSLSGVRGQKTEHFLSSLPGLKCLFAPFPSTSYWATFTESLRDKSSAYNPRPLKSTRMGGCRTTSSLYVRRHTSST